MFFSSLYFLNVSYSLTTWNMVLCMLVKQYSSCNTFCTFNKFCQLTVFLVMSFSSSNQQLFKSIQWRIQNKFIVLGIFITETNYTIIHLALSISLYFTLLFSLAKNNNIRLSIQIIKRTKHIRFKQTIRAIAFIKILCDMSLQFSNLQTRKCFRSRICTIRHLWNIVF